MLLRIHYIRYRCTVLLLAALAPALALVGCGSVPPAPVSTETSSRIPPKAVSSTAPKLPPAGSGRGGYYLDDGPGDAPPENLLATPDAEPQNEPYSTRSNKPYVVFGKTYKPITDDRPFIQRGVGSWYGKKFHGQKTSSGELYDMYKMTAAHPTLPIPSYARVTNVANGKQVIVRVNDRGPFHSSRIIDLSYTAALKLGYLGKGSSELEIERLLPDEIARMAKDRKVQQARAEQAIPTQEVLSAAAAVQTAPIASQTVSDSLSPKPQVVSAPVTSAGATSGFYLQLGAYSQTANAEAARARLAYSAPVILPPVEVVQQGVLYRLFSGPFASRDEAAAAASRLQEGGVFKPLIVQR
jgi:rare lipoprotein A